MLANRPDIIRQDYMDELCVLQDDVPSFPDDEAFEIIEKNLGRPMEQVLSAISERPIAAASLGQVSPRQPRHCPPPPSFQHRTSRSAAPVCAHSTPSCQHRTANDRPTTTPRSRRLHSARHLRRLPGTAGQEPLLTHHAPGLATGARADMMRQRTTASIPGQSWVMTRRARVVFAVRRQSRPAYRARRFSIPARASPPARDGQVAHA